MVCTAEYTDMHLQTSSEPLTQYLYELQDEFFEFRYEDINTRLDFLDNMPIVSAVSDKIPMEPDSTDAVDTTNEIKTLPISIDDWNRDDVLNWIFIICDQEEIDYEEIQGTEFGNYDGSSLKTLSEKEFVEIDEKRGKLFYHKLQKRLEKCNFSDSEETLVHSTTYLDNRRCSSGSNNTSASENEAEPQKVKKRGPGRPKTSNKVRRKSEHKTGRLWEFIRDLLLNPEYCPSLICWEDHDEGVFRFVSSDKVAKIWGSKRGNKDMNYEKLSRAMRYYYKTKVLQPVLGKRLVYKFGPNAKGWQTTNPNFTRI